VQRASRHATPLAEALHVPLHFRELVPVPQPRRCLAGACGAKAHSSPAPAEALGCVQRFGMGPATRRGNEAPRAASGGPILVRLAPGNSPICVDTHFLARQAGPQCCGAPSHVPFQQGLGDLVNERLTVPPAPARTCDRQVNGRFTHATTGHATRTDASPTRQPQRARGRRYCRRSYRRLYFWYDNRRLGPGSLFKQVQAAAKELGISRSKLIRIALEGFLDRRRDEEVTRRLNESYPKHPGKIDPVVQNLALEAMKRVE
jgi:hypothetical protein